MSKDKELVFKPTGTTVTQNTKGDYIVPQKDINEFMEQKGITKEIRNTLKAAEEELIGEGFNFVKDRVVENKERAVLRLGSGDGRLTLSVNPKVEITNLKTGEKETRFGQCRISGAKKIPSIFRRDGELLSKIEADCEKMFSK
jgi:hypothetical protein